MRAALRTLATSTNEEEEKDRSWLVNVFVLAESLRGREREREGAHGKSRLSTRAGFQAQ